MLRTTTLWKILFTSFLLLFTLNWAGDASAGLNVWTSSGPEGGSIVTLALDPQTPTTLYAGTWGGGVFKSTDGGGNWNAVNAGLTTTDVLTLALDPQTPTTLYAGTWGSGVFKSADGGANWSAFNTGLTNTDVRALALDPQTPTTLYAGTYGGGVFSIRQSAAPSFASTPATTAVQDALYSYDVTTADPDLLHGDALTITAPTLPGWLTLIDHGDGTAALSGTPTNADMGAHSIVLLVTDSTGLTDTQPFTVTVAAVAPAAALSINYPTGAPGSFFNITGTGYPANGTATITINGVVVGTVLTGQDGSFSITLQTAPHSGEGTYLVTVSMNPSATVQYQLKASAPLRPQEGELPVYAVPEDIAAFHFTYLPVVIRQ